MSNVRLVRVYEAKRVGLKNSSNSLSSSARLRVPANKDHRDPRRALAGGYKGSFCWARFKAAEHPLKTQRESGGDGGQRAEE